jgi:hypothetical protein
MVKSSGILVIFLALLIAGVLIAGCSSSTSASNATTSPTVTTIAVSSGPYSAGDIVKNPKSSSTSALLIISYDAASDTYERAYIYPNNDGSWGYRTDSRTEKISRSVIDKVYTQKLETRAISDVPITTPPPAVVPAAVYTSTVATAEATTTTASSPPRVLSIEPNTGSTGTTVSITGLKGYDFLSGATVTLVKSGSSDIEATRVNVAPPDLITCTFSIPSDAAVGYWHVLVTNPDKQYHKFLNGFTITQGTATTATTASTTTTTTA